MKSSEYLGNTELHEAILEECKEYDGWTHTFDTELFTEELKYNLTTLSGSEMDRWEFLKEVQFSREGAGIAPDEDFDYWWTVPQEEDFPIVYKFMEENSQYKDPVLSKLGAGHKLQSHNHGPDPQYLYNVSINEPEGTMFTIADEIVSYNPGDIYKLYVHNNHEVVNGNDTRYHLLFKGGRV